MRYLIVFTCFVALAAEPDWTAVDKHAVEFLQEYVRIQSISPPSNTAPCARLFQAELARNGLQPKLYPNGPTGQTNLVVRLKGRDSSKKPILLLNHLDVVPVDAKAWNMDPFAAILRDGQLLYMLERHQIEHQTAETIARLLTEAFDTFCAPTAQRAQA